MFYSKSHGQGKQGHSKKNRKKKKSNLIQWENSHEVKLVGLN